MKVLVITLDKSIFEPDSASLERLKEYASFCEKLSVVVLTRKELKPIVSGNMQVFATGSSSRLLYSLDALKRVKAIMAEEKHDLVTTQDPFDTGHIGWLIKRKYGIPWQCQVHGDILSPYFRRESIMNEVRVWIAKILLPKADGLRVVSERIKRSLIDKKVKLKKEPLVLPIFVDVKKFENAVPAFDLKQKYPRFEFLILMASRLSREKNLDLALYAMVELVKKHPRAGLVIVGEGRDGQRLRKLTKNLDLDSNVVFEPWSNDLASYYKTADLFVLTSNYEGWGMSVIEAAACSCPIVMTDVGCAGELIKNEESGIVVKVGDKKALVSAMEKLISDSGLRQKLAGGAKAAVARLPDKQAYLEAYERSLASLL